MKSIDVREGIVPIHRAKGRLARLLADARRTGRPIVITQHGRAAGVLLAPEEYEALSYRAKVVAAVERGIEDTRRGRTYSTAEIERHFDKRYGKDE